MLDIKFVRDNTELVRQAITNRQDSAPLNDILQLDAERRQKVNELEDLRRRRKELARDRETTDQSISEGRSLRDKIRMLEEEKAFLEQRLEEINRRLKELKE